MKPFKLEEAKAGKPVCTRDGRKARIICFDRDNDFSIVALIDETDVECFTQEGKVYYNADNYCDLFMVEEEEHFDVSELKPFDKVLVRDSNVCAWICDFFSNIADAEKYKFITISSLFNQCIPYNNETMHLLGTKKSAPEKYVNW